MTTASTKTAPARLSRLVCFAVVLLLVGFSGQLCAGDTGTANPTDALVQRIVALLEKRQGDGFWVAVNRLEALGKDAVPALTEQLQSPSEKARLGCAKALLQIGDPAAHEAALKTLAELSKNAKQRQVQIDAIEVYGFQGDPDDVVDVLNDVFDATTEPEVLIPLARTLWEVDHVDKARDRLVELLKSSNVEIRYEAALTLAELDYFEGDVRDILRSLKKEPTRRGRRAALLDRVMRLSRQLDRGIDQGEVLLEGTDPEKLLKRKEERIRTLEDQLDRVSRGGGNGSARSQTRADSLLEEVMRLIEEHYVDEQKTDRQKLLLSAIKGMVRSLDAHSTFMDPEETRQFSQSLQGEYHGIGAHVSKQRDAPLEILRPVYGGPAFRQGIESGDKVIDVNGITTATLTMNEIMKLLKGPRDTTVTLKVWRRGWTDFKEIEVTRQTIEVPSVHYEMLPHKVGYLRLTQFGKKSAQEFLAGLDALETDGIDGLLVDLRRNPGGYLDIAAIPITDLFVKGDLPIVTQKGRGEGVESEKAHYPTDEARTTYPIVVLVNGDSASAAEIFAGALQDFGRATLVGTRTFGKGTVQQPIPLKSMEGSQLKLTVQYYFLPLGRCVHTQRDEKGEVVKGGVEPDIEVRQERIPTWRLEQRVELRNKPEVLDYVDKHSDALESLIPLGDRGDPSRYPELDDLYAKLDTRATKEDLQAIVRILVRRRLEDRQSRPFAFESDLKEDRQLQVAIVELLKLMGTDPQKSDDFSWIPPWIAKEKAADDPEEEEDSRR